MTGGLIAAAFTHRQKSQTARKRRWRVLLSAECSSLGGPALVRRRAEHFHRSRQRPRLRGTRERACPDACRLAASDPIEAEVCDERELTAPTERAGRSRHGRPAAASRVRRRSDPQARRGETRFRYPAKSGLRGAGDCPEVAPRSSATPGPAAADYAAASAAWSAAGSTCTCSGSVTVISPSRSSSHLALMIVRPMISPA